MNYKMIKNVLGWILLFESLFMLVPLITAAVYWEKAFFSFLITLGICLVLGLVLAKKRPENTTLYSKEGFVIVSLSWIVLSLLGCLPFILSGSIPSFIDALFETVSGFSTTGATILADVESLPRSILMWRSFTHWVGGMGVLVFLMAFLPLSGGNNMHIMKAESTGPSVSKLVPRVKTTALILYSIYFALTALLFVILLFGDMTVFESLNTAFATAGTGGLGFRNDSMASFSPFSQIVITVFMLLFSINFGCFYLLFLRKFKEAFNVEVRCFIILVAVSIAIITLNTREIFVTLEDALRNVSFTVASIISTTGFSTVDFDLWPEVSKNCIVLLMFTGGCAGATCGGIKLSRFIILIKGMFKELHTSVHPKQVKKITIDSKPVEHEVVRATNSYMIAFLLVFVASMIAISFDDHDFTTNFTAVAAMLNNIGPGLEMVGPTQNYSFFSTPTKLVLIFDMLAGRLELFPMLLLFSPATWKK